ncbi:MAG: bifunctional nuclease family protein [Deltaproteobacteria bacterium]|nr:bifunctional nuclease family protein [Deltaproteobacteria bacterium]
MIRLLAIAGACLAGWIWPPGEAIAEGLTPVPFEQKELLQVKVHRLIADPTSQQPVVFLADSLEERALLIWIDFFEANAISWEIQGIKQGRPQTHELIKRILQKVNGTIHHIVISHIKKNIYYATIVVEREGSFVEIDARPSDSIVMALKFKAPIFVSKTLFREMAIPLEQHKGIEELYGFTLQDLTLSLAKAFSFGSTRGVLVSDVRTGSRAEEDGVERGDIFVEVGEQAVEDVILMKDALAKSETAVKVKIFRKAHFLTITLHPPSR